ncbi:molybdopterin-dependent oxidoreductase [Epibacterium sp. SM1979]|uniref:Molybdopterin-dependent oxidoreductase n=1 Tax=Tritonibacter litoralis TaxID=2662264 RepID=A0A843YG40_9RHOB|nr:nitrate reductase [Tritonibacter litoralis]MQQ10086.1 molybdopterin-dependent oxidoreductase [Tritonibacter litoralis]
MTTCTTCPYCGVGCGVLAQPDTPVSGDPNHPANFGRLCSKGTALGDTVGLEGRLLAPRLGGKDVSWDHALGLVAEKFLAAIRNHGPDSVAFYVSGQLLTEDYYVANKLMKGFIGSANIDTNSRLCMASSVAGHKRAFGSDTVPGQYEDFEQADLVVLVGSNTAWCHPVLFRRLEAAKAARPNMKIVVIDPRRTATAKSADLHLAIAPDGDAALFNRLLAEISRRGLINQEYVDAHVEGLGAALEAAGTPHPCGLPEDEIAQFLDMWCSTEKVVTLYSQGVNQSYCGSDKVNAILNCHLATGRIGRPGMGPFSMTGQPNAMGGREVGGLANMLACHLDLENAGHRSAVREFWAAPRMADKPGLKAVDLFQACADGKIKALWVMSTNPAVSMPEADQVAEAIRTVPFTVVSDILAGTDTNKCCDLLLPATGWGEKSGTVTNSERCISRQRPFLPTPGEARPDWAIIAEVGRRMGWAEAFDFANEAEVFREHAALSGVAAHQGRDFDISGLADLSDSDYDALAPTVWPVPADGVSPKRFFAGGGFYHADGKARMLAITPPVLADHGTALRLNTGRVRDQWHTMTRTGRAPQLGAHLAEPYLEIHPEDAARIGLEEAGLAEVKNNHGRALLRVLVSDKVRAGECFAPMHWTGETASQGRVNALVTGVVDPVSGQPALKGSSVGVTPYVAGWYGFAASAAQMSPARPYAAVARTKTGWRAEVAGHKLPQDWEGEARQILNLPDGEASVVEDAARGLVRVAIHRGPVLAGVFFAGPAPVAVARSASVDQIGREIAPLQVLAGVPGADQPAKGAIVCACMDVGREDLRRAIAGGANTIPLLGECTGAGTNCGSCTPEIQELLDSTSNQRMAAE